MVWCAHCKRTIVRPDYADGRVCCSVCGRVLEEDNFATEPTFVKNAAGQSQLSGNYVRTIESNYSASRERTLNEVRYDVNDMMVALQIDGGDSIATPAVRFYTIALERNFTRGRRRDQVAAACLYIACRENKKPYLLIDFSEYLRINVYVLGAVFLQLCLLLSLDQHPIVQKPVDPSLFIHRFTDRLFGDRKAGITKTALNIVASMKRDWIQTGRKPSGLCGAAIYISALSHGHKCSKSDIIKAVHVCEATLTKRLIEFENTESGGLTIEEFNMKALEIDKEERLTLQPPAWLKPSGISELLCEHKGSGETPFAHGLCEICYADLVKLSGGLDGGCEPPAFQRAEKERMMASEASAENAKFGEEAQIENVSQKDMLLSESDVTGAAPTQATIREVAYDKLHGDDGASPGAREESESLSDIDDVEVDVYLHNEEEKHFKKIIWEEMNKEYLEEQAAKEAAALAAKKAREASLTGCPEDIQAAQKLAAAAAAAVAKSRKEKQQKRAAELKSLGPPKDAAEAAKQMVTRKRLSSKINYDVLEKLFDDPDTSEKPKKSRSESVDDDNLLSNGKRDTEIEDNDKGGGGTESVYDQDYYQEDGLEGYDYDDQYDFE